MGVILIVKQAYITVIKAQNNQFQTKESDGGSVKKILVCSLVLTGCAPSTSEIQSAYVSPMQYQNYDCQQISMEMQRISRRTVELGGIIDEKASTDKAQMGVGMVLFWPSLFFLDGSNSVQTTEYSHLKGEFDALEQVAIQKKCDIKIERPVIKKPEPNPNDVPAYPNSTNPNKPR